MFVQQRDVGLGLENCPPLRCSWERACHRMQGTTLDLQGVRLPGATLLLSVSQQNLR